MSCLPGRGTSWPAPEPRRPSVLLKLRGPFLGTDRLGLPSPARPAGQLCLGGERLPASLKLTLVNRGGRRVPSIQTDLGLLSLTRFPWRLWLRSGH